MDHVLHVGDPLAHAVDPCDGDALEEGEEEEHHAAAGVVVKDLEDVDPALQRKEKMRRVLDKRHMNCSRVVVFKKYS